MTIELWKAPEGSNPNELVSSDITMTKADVLAARRWHTGDPALTPAQQVFRDAYLAAREEGHYLVVVDDTDDSIMVRTGKAPGDLVYPDSFGEFQVSGMRLSPSIEDNAPPNGVWCVVTRMRIRRNANGTYDLQYEHRGGAT